MKAILSDAEKWRVVPDCGGLFCRSLCKFNASVKGNSLFFARYENFRDLYGMVQDEYRRGFVRGKA